MTMAKAEYLELLVVQRKSVVDGLIARGKGEWPNKDYVRDEIWSNWHHESIVLGGILRRYREHQNETTLSAKGD